MTQTIKSKPDLLGMLPEKIDELVAGRGLEAYRSAQITEWLYRHNARSFGEMTNLPKRLREKLTEEFLITDIKALRARVSERDRTKKILFELGDGMTVETVLMPEAGHSTVCVSTQVGCAFGCVFCASGSGGLARNLTTGEIIDQARWGRFDPNAGR
ncbi:MAG: 23S rRNA (adenine(2503)-C(2))-methyltransferase RlmN, partial [Candidatus Lindowbacteria bacterium]|nr:23S rRNA (adenine(2503)-C(2))-methyltransferase RlmN [Candidatus Lindowbacteria bacterium]